MKRVPAEITKYKKKFILAPSELGYQAYYNIQYYKFSEALKKHKHILHIYLKEPLKLSKIKLLFKLQEMVLNQYFNNEGRIYRYNSISHTIIEVEKLIRFVPDISMYRELYRQKEEIERRLKMMIGQTICILNPKIKEVIPVIPPIAKFLEPNHDYGLVRTYKEALKLIDTNFDHIPSEVEGI